MLRGSEINSNSKQRLINDRKHSLGKRYLPQDNGQMSKKLKLENKSLFKNWLEISVRDVTDFLVRRFQSQSV